MLMVLVVTWTEVAFSDGCPTFRLSFADADTSPTALVPVAVTDASPLPGDTPCTWKTNVREAPAASGNPPLPCAWVTTCSLSLEATRLPRLTVVRSTLPAVTVTEISAGTPIASEPPLLELGAKLTSIDAGVSCMLKSARPKPPALTEAVLLSGLNWDALPLGAREGETL